MLAIDTRGRLFSWGYGKSGRLGHGDVEDRHSPTLVQFFAGSLWVDYCAAGDAHSAVLTRSRSSATLPKTPWDPSPFERWLPPYSSTDKDSAMETRRLSTFGRGAHGRLGNGSNRTCSSPVVVSEWPTSITKKGVNRWQLLSVACGGAHTVALAVYPVRKCLANPWGMETVVLAWGYGSNGQLGDGDNVDRFIPVRARLPHRCEVIAEIAAGRSWSVARAASGVVYTWGKGWRGQLGQGLPRFSMVPRKVPALASFLKLSAGYAHNVGITTKKKLLNAKLLLNEVRREQIGSYGSVLNSLQGQSLSLMKRKGSSMYAFDW